MAIINGRGRVGIRRPSAAATPSIILDGLKLYLDAGNATSYAGTGTVWTDLSGNGNNGTLVNGGSGLTFNSANGGTIQFDGANDYVSINTPASINLNNDITINVWVKFISLSNFPRIIEIKDSLYSIQILVDGNLKFATKNSKWQINLDNNYWSTAAINTWYNIVCVFTPSTNTTTFYQNGVQLSSTTGANVGIGNQSNKIILGVRSDFHSMTWLNSYLSNLQIYNRALSATEVLQNYNTLKSRFYPQVSDSDAQAFIYAANIQNSTQASAVNTLVTSLKSAGIWTKMKAVYPFVGGSAASHKFNLKDTRDLDAAYRLMFTVGWVHSSTGAKPNGTSDYADTKFIPATNFTAGAGHISYYSRTNSFGVKRDISAYGSGNIYSYSRFDSANSGWFRFSGAEVGYSNSDSRGWYMMSRTSTNSYFYKNSVYKAGGASSTFGASVISIGGGTAGTYSDREIAFASIGDYLTDAENTSFCAIVQTYQTALGRQV